MHMKRQYIKPAAETIVLMPHANFLITSLEKTEEEAGGGGALSNGHRTDWDNIWENM